MRALLGCPPLALSAFALATAALLGERLLPELGGVAPPEPPIAISLVCIGVAIACGAFWLGSALRLAGLLAAPPNRGTRVGAVATAGIGAVLAPIELGGPAADALALCLSATCFATFFLLHVLGRA